MMPDCRTRSPWRPLLCLLLLPCAGCWTHVAWLPDSGGFVYVGGVRDNSGTTLRHYDVRTGRTRVLARREGAERFLPQVAVSPDSSYVACGLADRTASPAEFRLGVFAFRTGRELRRSANLADRPPTGLIQFQTLAPWWSPDPDRLVLLNQQQHGRVGAFQWKQGEWLGGVEGAVPVLVGGSPVCPNGRGFLVATGQDVQLIDWEGKALPLAVRALPGVNKEQLHGQGYQAFFGLSGLLGGRWEGDTAVLHLPLYQDKVEPWVEVRLDTAKRTGTVGPAKLPRTADGDFVLNAVRFPETGAVVRVVGTAPPAGGGEPQPRAELLPPGAAKPRKLCDGMAVLFPAPDGLRVVVASLDTSRPTLWLVDARGEIRATLDRSE